MSKNDNAYFDMKLQTSTNRYRAIRFSPGKHATFKRKFESDSPIRMSKFQLKVNQRDNEEEIIINKRTKLMDCDEETVG